MRNVTRSSRPAPWPVRALFALSLIVSIVALQGLGGLAGTQQPGDPMPTPAPGGVFVPVAQDQP